MVLYTESNMTLLAMFLYFATVAQGAAPLEKLNIDIKGISTSGCSSGASMASQLHVAYSASIMGAGIFAGSPYYCAEGVVFNAIGRCMTSPFSIPVRSLQKTTGTYARNGYIDGAENMKNDRIFIFQGSKDTTVHPGVGKKVREYYQAFVDSKNIKTIFDVPAVHGMPTVKYGTPCGGPNFGGEYILSCNFSGAYHALQHIYGSLKEPKGHVDLKGQFRLFDQKEFFYLSSPLQWSVAEEGYIYVPTACTDKKTNCKLHVVFHGCLQGREFIGDHYARHTGYNEVGELNKIVILYPQVDCSWRMDNMNGCWDWWGYNGNMYAKQIGHQLLAVKRMIDKLSG